MQKRIQEVYMNNYKKELHKIEDNIKEVEKKYNNAKEKVNKYSVDYVIYRNKKKELDKEYVKNYFSKVKNHVWYIKCAKCSIMYRVLVFGDEKNISFVFEGKDKAERLKINLMSGVRNAKQKLKNYIKDNYCEHASLTASKKEYQQIANRKILEYNKN